MLTAPTTFPWDPSTNHSCNLRSLQFNTSLSGRAYMTKGMNDPNWETVLPPSHGSHLYLHSTATSLSWTSAQIVRRFLPSGGSWLWGLESCPNCISLMILLEWWYDASQVPGNLAKETDPNKPQWISHCSQVNRMFLSGERQTVISSRWWVS